MTPAADLRAEAESLARQLPGLNFKAEASEAAHIGSAGRRRPETGTIFMQRSHLTALLLAVAAFAICTPQSGADEVELRSQSCNVLQLAAASSLANNIRPHKTFLETPGLGDDLESALQEEIAWKEGLIARFEDASTRATTAEKRAAKKLIKTEADLFEIVDAAAECSLSETQLPGMFQDLSCRQKFLYASDISQRYTYRRADGQPIYQTSSNCIAPGLTTAECQEVMSLQVGNSMFYGLYGEREEEADEDDLFSMEAFDREQAELRFINELESAEPLPIPYIRSARQCLRDALDE